jgi:hypothetical protein
MKLSSQAALIYNILLDGEWHCPIEWGYADGHCKRITDINEFLKGTNKKVIGKACFCGRHTSAAVKMRKLVDEGITTSENPIVQDFFNKHCTPKKETITNKLF